MSAKPTSAYNYLSWAKAAGHIYDFGRLDHPRGFLWRIDTIATRYDAYHDPEARGTIVLTTREVMAFTEGLWAASKVNPSSRAS